MVRTIALGLFGSIVFVACGGAAPKPVEGPPPPAKEDSPTEIAPPAASGAPVDIDCGDFATCAVTEGGQARCWGRDKDGELGDGGGQDRMNVVAGLGKVSKVVLASRFACALVEGGKVMCWGSGHIANDGKPYTNAKPTAVSGVSGAEEITASGTVACARAGATVTCWGLAKSIGAPPPGTYTQIATGFSHACALDKAGSVVCWGSGEWGGKGSFARPPIKDAKQIATGDRHACVITKDKKVQCWGNNDSGQLGTKPDADPRKKPVEIPNLKDVARLAAGETSTCAILADGSAYCWGSNAEGELGLGKASPDERPGKVVASNLSQLCLASSHGCALTREKKIACWGKNQHGQIGDGTKELRRLQPTATKW